jgi:hypothetical protein
MADQQATRQRNLMTEPQSLVNNLATVQLRINGISITRDSQKWLMETAGEFPIAYYLHKHGWLEHTFQSIAWDVQSAVLKTFKVTDQIRILKFVHGWLPTAHHLHKEGTAITTRCKLCGALTEDNLHLFSCHAPEMQLIHGKLQQSILKTCMIMVTVN